MKLNLDSFVGIDTRPGKMGENVPGFVVASNVDLITGGAVRRRPAMRFKANLHAESVGLYARGGFLRAVIPGGHSLQVGAPTGVVYDPIGVRSGGVGTGNLDRVTMVTITAPGTGYATVPTVTFTGGGGVHQATAVAEIALGGVVLIRLVTRGTGYTSAPTITITGGGGTGAAATASISAGAFAYPLGKLERLIAADTYGASLPFGPNGLVLVRRSDNHQSELHWLRQPPEDPAFPVDTRISLPFQPGESMIKLDEKVWIPDPANGSVRFSSSVNGPVDFTTVGDAGFLPVANHVSGNRGIVAVSHHRNRLAVLFADAMQLWHVDVDPDLMNIQSVLNGPGAVQAGTVVNVLGDLVYRSRGGWRNLGVDNFTGDSSENDAMGTPIKTLSDLLDDETPASALWSQRRSQYLCVIGGTVYAWTYLLKEKRVGWTTWALPASIDHLVELDGELYGRGGDVLYHFDDTQDRDYNGILVRATVQSRTFLLNGGRNAELQWLFLRQSTAATWTMIVDGVARAPRRYRASPDRPLQIPLSGYGREIAFRVEADDAWRLDGLRIETQAGV